MAAFARRDAACVAASSLRTAACPLKEGSARLAPHLLCRGVCLAGGEQRASQWLDRQGIGAARQDEFAELTNRMTSEGDLAKALKERLADASGAAQRRETLTVERATAYRNVFAAVIAEERVLNEMSLRNSGFAQRWRPAAGPSVILKESGVPRKVLFL
jgi:hypothetical protein